MVGYARTAKIAALDPPTEPPKVIKTRRMDYYRHMASGPRPAIAVIEDADFPHCIGAYWGEINTTVHKGLGLSGALTNGVMRDLGDLPNGFPVVAGSIGPSHGFVHVREIGARVTIFGMVVNDGDLIHADRHGALVVPPEVVGGLGKAIKKLLETEKLILEPARKQEFDIEAFEIAWAAFEASRT
jgi:regulator of RNase E activity RraA